MFLQNTHLPCAHARAVIHFFWRECFVMSFFFCRVNGRNPITHLRSKTRKNYIFQSLATFRLTTYDSAPTSKAGGFSHFYFDHYNAPIRYIRFPREPCRYWHFTPCLRPRYSKPYCFNEKNGEILSVRVIFVGCITRSSSLTLKIFPITTRIYLLILKNT